MTHGQIDRINLALNRIAARRIETDPKRKGLDIALTNIRRWRANGTTSMLYDNWEKIITSGDWKTIRHYLSSRTPLSGIPCPWNSAGGSIRNSLQ
jgi:hypothetical protein